jgi:hypothetical protein
MTWEMEALVDELTPLVILDMPLFEKWTFSFTKASKNPGPGVSLRQPGLQSCSSISYKPTFLASFVFIFLTMRDLPAIAASVPANRHGWSRLMKRSMSWRSWR